MFYDKLGYITLKKKEVEDLSKKQLNVGLVGYKFMGKAHSNAYRQAGMFFELPVTVNMKTLCGREEAWVKDTAEKYGWEGYATDWKNLAADPDIDIVDICTPSNAHKEIAVEAAKAGKHIFCEKPLALSLADAREMLAEAQKTGVKHQIGFNYRFAPAVRLAKKMIDEGRLGRIFHYRGKYLQDFVMDPNFPLVWRLDKKVCGSGAHGDLGAHIIDLARFLVGDFKSVTGMSKTFIKQRPLAERMEGLTASASDTEMGEVHVDDATCFVAEFESGALATIESTRFAKGHKNDLSFEINGEKGSLRFELERMNELWYFNAEDEEGFQGFRLIQASEGVHPYMHAWWPVGHVIGYEHTFVHEMVEFFNAIANNTPTSPDFGDGVRCSQILEAVDISIERRAWVDVASI